MQQTQVRPPPKAGCSTWAMRKRRSGTAQDAARIWLTAAKTAAAAGRSTAGVHTAARQRIGPARHRREVLPCPRMHQHERPRLESWIEGADVAQVNVLPVSCPSQLAEKIFTDSLQTCAIKSQGEGGQAPGAGCTPQLVPRARNHIHAIRTRSWWVQYGRADKGHLIKQFRQSRTLTGSRASRAGLQACAAPRQRRVDAMQRASAWPRVARRAPPGLPPASAVEFGSTR